MKKLILVSALVAMTGCAGSPLRTNSMNAESLKQESTLVLCGSYGYKKTEKVKRELLRRNEFKFAEWNDIQSGLIGVGTSELALICTWGYPKKVNSSTGKWGISKQYVYDSNFVYVRNGKISSYSN